MINAEKLLKELNGFADVYYGLGAEPKFQSLVQSLKEEIALAEQKKAGKADRFKAALRNSKKINKEWQYIRPAMAGAFIGESGKQYLTNTYYVARFDVPLEGLVMASNEGTPPQMDKVIDTYNSSLKVKIPALAELKTKLKTDKAEGNLDGEGRSLTEIECVYYNTDYLIQVSEMVEPTEAYFSSDSKFPMLILIGNGAQGAICPMKHGEGRKK